MKILAFHAHKGDPLSFLIKALMRTQYCHGAVLIDSPEWRAKIAAQFKVQGAGHLIIEEYYPKVRARLLTNDELSEIDVFDVPSHGPDKESKSMEYMIEQIVARLPYDIPDLFRFSQEFRAVMGEAKDDAYKRHQFCSQFVFNSYRMGGTKLLECHDFEFSPDKMSWSPFAVPLPKLTPLSVAP